MSNSRKTAENQPNDGLGDFLGGSEDEKEFARESQIKTISTGYCNFNGERAKIANAPVLCGRIGGVIMGTERQLRNPEAVEKAIRDKKPVEDVAEYGIALVGNFNADVYDDDGVVTAEYADCGFCYLPSGFHEAALSKFQGLDDEAIQRGMPFSAFVIAIPRSNLRGYSWELKAAARVDKNRVTMARLMQQEARLALAHIGQGLLTHSNTPAE